jgi:hypothetical protein
MGRGQLDAKIHTFKSWHQGEASGQFQVPQGKNAGTQQIGYWVVYGTVLNTTVRKKTPVQEMNPLCSA